MSGWYELNEDGTTTALPDGAYPARFDADHKRIAESTVGGMWVSTVFLGLNHQLDDGPPLLFETMVFPERGNYSEMLCWRYTTKTDAAACHAFLVAELEAGKKPDDIEQPGDES